MASVEARKDRSVKDRPEKQTEQAGGRERRVFPRHAVDCAVVVFPVSGAGQVRGRLSDLSLGGCRVTAEHRYTAGILVRVEVQFQLRGIAFRLVGVTAGSREAATFAIRFLEMPTRRRQELAEVLDEVGAQNTAKQAAVSNPAVSRSLDLSPNPVAPVVLASRESPSPAITATATDAGDTRLSVNQPPKTPRPAERRSQRRHAVDTNARLLLIKTAISMPGRILNLSLSGCRIRTEERFNVGIYVRVEAEFYLHGLPFRVGGVSQAIVDQNTIGVRFLDMSERRREQLAELIAEIAAATAEPATEPVGGTVGKADEIAAG
jgi:c-di-GMP-binding flagellar brake protein YcgR